MEPVYRKGHMSVRMAIAVGACLVGACLLATLFASGCWSPAKDNVAAPPSGTTTPLLPPSFSVERYRTFEEAERVAGYHIPHTTAYALRWDTVFLQPTPRDLGARMAGAIFVGPRDTSFYLDVVPPPTWSEGPPSGGLREETVGGWEGVLLAEEDDRVEFAFVCGEFEGADLWCAVNAPDLTMSELADFLATLR